jgi:6-phosphogluconate dehydrogenase
MKSEIGLIGLSTMGANLARNIADKGFSISVFNRTTTVTEKFINDFATEKIIGKIDLEDFVKSIETPRKIIIMVKAGDPVDKVIASLLPYLGKGDLLIDCGNSNFQDTIRREKDLKEKGILFQGTGVSGGEEGALNGPSIMPGGTKESWEMLKDIFTKISAKDFSGGSCVSHIGENGAGHYVKMVHNGIEYAVLQMMAEAYDLLKNLYSMTSEDIANVFSDYNKGKLKSFLFEISVPVLSKKDDNGEYLLDKILDSAGQKGTGRWTVIDSLNTGVSGSTIASAVFARITSTEKEKRTELNKLFQKEKSKTDFLFSNFKNLLEDALYVAMLIAYAEGYELIKKSAKENNWDIDLAEVSRIWQGGCIIRSEILRFLEKAYKSIDDENVHFFEIDEITKVLKEKIYSLKKIVLIAIENSLVVPSFASALFYFESMTHEQASANLIQGLRDYFGAHTYKRLDMDGDFHTKW